MNNRFIFGFVVRVILIFSVLFSAISWFWYGPETVELHSDEVVWILDSEVYSKYVAGNWDFFAISADTLTKSWLSRDYRIIDQPQLGKYIFGFFLSVADLKPWKNPNKVELYTKFVAFELPKGYPQDLQSELGSELVASILLLRRINQVISFIVIVLISIALQKYSKSIEAGLVIFLLLINHSGIGYQFNVVAVDLHALFFQFLAVVSMIFGLPKIATGSQKEVVKWAVAAGAATALTTSTKLSGAFLVFVPYTFFIYQVVKAGLNKKDLKIKYVFNAFVWSSFFIISGLIVFFILEPELWVNPVQNIGLLINARLLQQQKFLLHFENLTFIQVFQTIIINFLHNKVWVWLLLFLVFIKEHMNDRKQLYQRLASLKRKPFFLALILSPIILATFYYGRVGFDRYFYPAVVCLYCLVVTALLSNTHIKDVKKN